MLLKVTPPPPPVKGNPVAAFTTLDDDKVPRLVIICPLPFMLSCRKELWSGVELAVATGLAGPGALRLVRPISPKFTQPATSRRSPPAKISGFITGGNRPNSRRCRSRRLNQTQNRHCSSTRRWGRRQRGARPKADAP